MRREGVVLSGRAIRLSAGFAGRIAGREAARSRGRRSSRGHGEGVVWWWLLDCLVYFRGRGKSAYVKRWRCTGRAITSPPTIGASTRIRTGALGSPGTPMFKYPRTNKSIPPSSLFPDCKSGLIPPPVSTPPSPASLASRPWNPIARRDCASPELLAASPCTIGTFYASTLLSWINRVGTAAIGPRRKGRVQEEGVQKRRCRQLSHAEAGPSARTTPAADMLFSVPLLPAPFPCCVQSPPFPHPGSSSRCVESDVHGLATRLCFPGTSRRESMHHRDLLRIDSPFLDKPGGNGGDWTSAEGKGAGRKGTEKTVSAAGVGICGADGQAPAFSHVRAGGVAEILREASRVQGPELLRRNYSSHPPPTRVARRSCANYSIYYSITSKVSFPTEYRDNIKWPYLITHWQPSQTHP